jgi:ethanolamine transporter EutH
MDWFFDSKLPILIGIFIGGLIAYPFVKRLQARKEAREKQKERDGEDT